MKSDRRVVITGLGLITPLGLDQASFWDALRCGVSVVHQISGFDSEGLTTRIGGEVRDFKPRDFVPKSQRKNLKVMARDIQLGVAAAQLALDDAGLGSIASPERIGVEFGASMISTELDDLAQTTTVQQHANDRFDYLDWGTRSMERMPPLWLLKYLPNMPACHVSILNDLRGPNNSITMAEASSNLAIGEAYQIILRGSAEIMVAGGCDSKFNPLAMAKLCLQSDSSQRNDSPETACRPFDRDRDGMVPAEGSAVLILEELEHAVARDAQIYGEIIGFGSGADACKPGTNSERGAGYRIAINRALESAGISPDQVGYYNAHGVSTVAGDRIEALAFGKVFGDSAAQIPVSAHKSNFGNSIAASGSIELAAGLMALQHNLIPPTINCDHQDPECNLNLVTGEPRVLERPCFLSANSTRLGQASALVVKGYGS